MQILRTIPEMRQACATARGSVHGELGLVPTMGALHEGHRSLIQASRRECETVAVSIFVNPTQFAPGEDLDRYPRTFTADCALLEQEGVDLLFAPSTEEMYPVDRLATFVEVPGIGDRLDGISRPGHLRAVATVVAKLFNIISPEVAFFGQKDAAQVAVLRAMVDDLNFAVRLVICPTVREPDGLALSSRNRYLSTDERSHALTLCRALTAAHCLGIHSRPTASSLRQTMLSHLLQDPSIRVDYAEVVHPDTLEPLDQLRDGALLAVAAWVGETRLIDNLLLSPDSTDGTV